MKKIQNKHKQEQVLYTFRHDQIVAGDVREFLEKYDPFRLPGSRIKELFGNLVLGFEGVENAAVATHPEMRVLLRRLHAIWPWSGYFLDLEAPIGPANAINNYPLLGIGLSLSDFVMCRWATTNQLRISVVAAELSEASGNALQEWAHLPETTRCCVTSSVGNVLAPWTREPLCRLVKPPAVVTTTS
jgi:hypothetical protein